MQTRKTPRTMREIQGYIRTVKAFAREDLESVHLLPCDFEKVRLKPSAYDVTEQSDGRLVTTFRGRLIDVLPSQ